MAGRLREAGHDALAIDLPGHGVGHHAAVRGHARPLRRRVCEALAEGPPALLTGHEHGRHGDHPGRRQLPGALAGLIYVAAFVPQDGQSLLEITQFPEAAGDSVQANIVVDGRSAGRRDARRRRRREALYHCADA